MTVKSIKAAIMAAFFLPSAGCSPASSDEVEGGGLAPPSGFLTQADADCRLAALEASIPDLEESAPETRQLNGQTLLQYGLAEGDMVLCVVRHTDGSVADIRVILSD